MKIYCIKTMTARNLAKHLQIPDCGVILLCKDCGYETVRVFSHRLSWKTVARALAEDFPDEMFYTQDTDGRRHILPPMNHPLASHSWAHLLRKHYAIPTFSMPDPVIYSIWVGLHTHT